MPTDYSERSAISIGSLLANSEAVVVDDSNRIVPIYSQGELLVRGKGLSKGYVENKVNDNKNFLVEINEQTYYRTGDIVSFDGQRFHYIDRKDSQVKINGYRVEVLEIENRIKEIIGVKNAKVMIGEDKLITLFYTGGISKRELKSTLANKFPSYMNPKLVYQIKTMPLTLNGKIDKDKLLTIKNDNGQENLSEIKVVAPKLSDIILKYTDSKNIESDASFHDLGIDSMKTIRLNKELKQNF
nr:AMP-binding protein [Staphylococcus lugdunensis]